jgi:hypothetical protein
VSASRQICPLELQKRANLNKRRTLSRWAKTCRSTIRMIRAQVLFCVSKRRKVAAMVSVLVIVSAGSPDRLALEFHWHNVGCFKFQTSKVLGPSARGAFSPTNIK